MSQPEINPDKLVPKPILKPAIFSVLILVSGIIIGSGITLMTAERLKKKPVPSGPEYMSKRMVERLIRELHLLPEQQEQLRPIMEQHIKAMDDIRREARPRIAEEIKQLNDAIMAILDEEQKQIWIDKTQRMKDNFPRMHQRRRRGHTPQDRRDPNFRPNDPRPPRPYRNRPPESRKRPDIPPRPGTERMEKPVP